VKVPAVEEELKRSRGRLRGQLRDERKRIEAQGRSLLLNYGIEFEGRWWTKTHWPEVKKLVCKQLAEILGVLQQLIIAVHEKLEKLTQELEDQANKERPKGFGKLTTELLDREIVDWNRFKNRRQVASYAGLCPGVAQSEDNVHMKSITKTGNSRIRHMLIEIVWMLIRYQPEYYAVKKWHAVLEATGGAAKRKAVVAIARCLIVDLWRLNTNRASYADLGLVRANA
jgi:transposase